MAGVVAHALSPGGVINLTENQLADAGEAGMQEVSQYEAQQSAVADKSRQYVDENYGVTGKAALGLANGLTLGIGPAYAASKGLIDPNNLAAAKDSAAFTGGDLAGMILPSFLSGGEGLVARGLAATPAGLMGRAGGLAESILTRALPEAGLLGKVGSGAAQMAARGATEGALMNMAHQASDDIITNKPLAAQALLAAGADGALFGGLAGGLMGGAASLAGSGLQAAGKLSSRSTSAESSAAKALRRLGIDDVEGYAVPKLARGAEEAVTKDGPMTGHLRDYVDVLQKSETSLAATTPQINAAVKSMVAEQDTVIKAALSDLDKAGRPNPSSVMAITDRLDAEYGVMYAKGADHRAAAKIYEGLKEDLAPSAKFGMSWETLAKNREIIADRAKVATGIEGDIYKSALNAYDDEFRIAGEHVDAEAFKRYAAATTLRRTGLDIIKGTESKMLQEATQGSPLKLGERDYGTLAMGAVTSHPLGSAAIVSARKVGDYVSRKAEPLLAEWAARSALGSAAGKATADAGNQLSTALKRFMTGSRIANEDRQSKPKSKVSYTMAAYDEQMKLADQLTSSAHRAKVAEHTRALAMAGHDELAKQMQDTYDRAAGFVQHNSPRKGAAMGTVMKLPKTIGLDTKSMKFLRQIHSLRDPIGTIVNGLEKGNISTDAIAAIKHVMPDLHADLVMRASQEVLQMKQEGKFLPADKVASLSIALGYPVDTKLSPEFINEIQNSFAQEQQPPQQQQGVATADMGSYQTPVEGAA